MTGTLKLLPWILSAILLILLGLNWHNSQLNLAQKNAEMQSLKQQYDQLTIEATSKVEEANSKLKRLADDANKKLQLASQPEIQLRVSFRKALMHSGNVAMFLNLSRKIIAITATINRPLSGKTRSFDMTIDPGRHVKEIGEREGWAFVPGDTLTISQPGHKPLIVLAP